MTFLDAELVGSAAVPLSSNGSIAITDTNTACVVHSYDVRIVCARRDGSIAGMFGRQGQGPGEFGRALRLVRGPSGTVGVFDGNQSRLTVLQTDGSVVTEIPLPFLFHPMAAFNHTVVGEYVVYYGAPSGALVAEVDAHTGEILGERRLAHPSDLGLSMDCTRGFSTGALAPSGDMAFKTCQQDLVIWKDSADGVTTFRDPTYLAQLPTTREVEGHREGLERVFGRPASESELLRYQQTPKGLTITGRPLIYDSRGRLWVATQRDREHFSFLSVFDDTLHVGSLRVRDRIEGFGVLDSIVVVLVEPPDAQRGIGERRIDWYSIKH